MLSWPLLVLGLVVSSPSVFLLWLELLTIDFLFWRFRSNSVGRASQLAASAGTVGSAAGAMFPVWCSGSSDGIIGEGGPANFKRRTFVSQTQGHTIENHYAILQIEPGVR
jgi:hypothetical protein